MLIGSAVAGVLLLRAAGPADFAQSDRAAAGWPSTQHGGGPAGAPVEGRSRAEQAKLDAVLRKPENAQVLDRSVLLNSLLYRKGISWTKIFADLEKMLPHNVRVISIRPVGQCAEPDRARDERGGRADRAAAAAPHQAGKLRAVRPYGGLEHSAALAKRAAVPLRGERELCPKVLASCGRQRRSGKLSFASMKDPRVSVRAALGTLLLSEHRRGADSVQALGRIGGRPGAAARRACASSFRSGRRPRPDPGAGAEGGKGARRRRPVHGRSTC